MNAEQNKSNPGFMVVWVVITTLTFLMATATAFATMWSIGGRFLDGLDAPLSGLISGVWVGALMGLGLGIGQALALHGRGINPVRWALISAAGAGFADVAFHRLTKLPGTSLMTAKQT